MTRWSVIAISVVISACEHGETPPPRCGDRVVDFGEQCDDGNDIADDGCDQCVAMNCGNSRIDEFEECDDGNETSLDGCDAACQLEGEGNGVLTAFWTFQNLDGTITNCPVDAPIVQVVTSGIQTTGHRFQFDCSMGFAEVVVPRDQLVVEITARRTDTTQIFAVSQPQSIDLRFVDQTVMTTFFNDAGVFAVAWELVGAQSGLNLDCGQANVASITLDTPGNTHVFPCSALFGVTSPLAVGPYSVVFNAVDARGQPVAAPTTIESEITVPIGSTGLGEILFSIPGL